MISTILLADDDTYVKDGKLPKGRPDWDKELLTALCDEAVVTHKAYDMLPKSIKSKVYAVEGLNPTVGVTIPEIAKSKLLIVVRAGIKSNGGKKFRFDNFKKIVKSGQLEIWRRK